mmetsp:Transcript_7505/g.23476  ORF Transcript_7505/g.23476 Transcript_7505/m.23476 type:complete len:270 (-) Transcript_7505:831-1640(-)
MIDQSDVIAGAMTPPYRPASRINPLMALSAQSPLATVVAATTTSSNGSRPTWEWSSGTGFGSVFERISQLGAPFSSASHSTYAARPFSVDLALLRMRCRSGSPRTRSADAMNLAFDSSSILFNRDASPRLMMSCSSTLSSHASRRTAGTYSGGSGAPAMKSSQAESLNEWYHFSLSSKLASRPGNDAEALAFHSSMRAASCASSPTDETSGVFSGGHWSRVTSTQRDMGAARLFAARAAQIRARRLGLAISSSTCVPELPILSCSRLFE